MKNLIFAFTIAFASFASAARADIKVQTSAYFQCLYDCPSWMGGNLVDKGAMKETAKQWADGDLESKCNARDMNLAKSRIIRSNFEVSNVYRMTVTVEGTCN